MSAKAIYLVLGFLSLVLFLRILVFYHGVRDYPSGTFITWQTTLLDQPALRSGGQQVTLSMPNSQRIVVRFGLNPLLSYGDEVKIQGEITYFEAKDGKQVAFMNYPKFELLKKGSEANFFIRFREKIIDFFNSALPQDYAALMLGIVFGIKEEMSAAFYLALQKVGLMHVIAASGMNITMVAGFLIGLFSIFLRRQNAIVMSILGIIFYAFLAGLEPSIVRAAIMGIVVFLAQLSGRQSSGFLALFLAGFIMLMRSPSLIFDIGFQLSFMATFGLIFLRPVFGLNPKLKRFSEKSVVGEDLATTLTAQIMTLPILLVNFGAYSFWSIPVNAIVLWTVPILMVIGGISALIALILEPLGRLVLYFCVPFLLYFSKIVEVFSNFPGYIQIKNLPFLLICGYYLIILSLILHIRHKK